LKGQGKPSISCTLGKTTWDSKESGGRRQEGEETVRRVVGGDRKERRQYRE